ncbi:MAG: PPC domain-containing protein, partial [Gemmataceae bacterium]|nr:PPC domain-containing protein [Gemmataceae bacterium]
MAFDVDLGRTYYVQVAASSYYSSFTRTGPYTLLFDPGDDFGDQFTTAHFLTLERGGSGRQLGTIHYPGDIDLFWFVAPLTGTLRVHQTSASGNAPDSDLAVFDAARAPIVANASRDWESPNQVEFNVLRGAIYYVQTAASTSRAVTGDPSLDHYQLTFTLVRNLSEAFASPDLLTLAPDGTASRSGTLASAGAAKVFRFVATQTGAYQVTQEAAPASRLDSNVTVFDGTLRQLAFQDDIAVDNVNSRARFHVVAGRTYYIQAAASPFAARQRATGAFQLTVAPIPDDVGDLFAHAAPLVLSRFGSASTQGIIESPGDVDLWRFVATVTGQLTICQDAHPGEDLDTFLTVFDGNQHLLAFNDDGDHGTDSLVRFPVVAGRTYYLQARNSPHTSSMLNLGAYDLTLSTALAMGPSLLVDDFGNSLADAQLLRVNSREVQTVSGTTELAGDVDTFRFVAPQTGGPLEVTLRATNGSGLVPFLYAFNSTGEPLAADYDKEHLSRGVPESQLALRLLRGETYFLQVAGFRTSQGSYQLILTLADDFDDELATAQPIPLEADGSASIAGSIAVDGDVDVFQFVASQSGLLRVGGIVPPDSLLASDLSVFDSSQRLLRSSSLIRRADLLPLPVVQGQTYYVRVAASSFSASFDAGTTGRYLLTLDFSDAGNDFATARRLTLAPDGSGARLGTLDQAREVDYYQFVAPLTTRLLIQQEATNDSLNSVVTIFDARQRPLTPTDNSGQGVERVVLVDVVAGQTYYVRAAARVSGSSPSFDPGALGQYLLTFAPLVDDFGDVPASAHLLPLAPNNFASQRGRLEVVGDVDVFRFVARQSGKLIISQEVTSGDVPGSSVMPADSTSISSGILKTMILVFAYWRT